MIAAPDGTVYIADYGNKRVRKIGTDCIITTYAGTGIAAIISLGDGGPATSANLSGPRTLALDPQGNLFVADPKSEAGGSKGSSPLPRINWKLEYCTGRNRIDP